MRRTDKNWTTLDEMRDSFLPDPATEDASNAAVELRERLVKVEQQVLAQYTATAAYATIAKQNVDTCRAEARADLDRVQGTVVALIEKLRNEVHNRLGAGESLLVTSPAVAGVDAMARLAALEEKLATMSNVLERTVRENETLRAQVAGFVEQRMQEDGWLVSSGSASELSLR